MSNDASTLEILIDIRARLAELAKAQTGMRDVAEETRAANAEASKFATAFRQGLGIGTGMEIAQRALGLFRATVETAAREAFRLAGEVRDGSEAIGFSGEAYQVFQLELAKSNVEMGRLSMAVATQTQGLAQIRAGAAGAAEAYRTLGLDAASVEALNADQRVLAVARAANNATDQTKAFQAASQILGSRGLAPLLAGLRDVAADYGKVAAAAKQSGQVMDDDVAKRLDAAQKRLEKFRRQMTVAAGEVLTVADAVGDAAQKDFLATAKALLIASIAPNGALAALAPSLVKSLPPPEPEKAKSGLSDDEIKRQDALRESLAQARLRLATVQQAASVAEQNTTESSGEREQRRLALLAAEVAWRERIVALTEQVQQLDDKASPTEKEGELVKLTAELTAARNALASALGKDADMPAARLEVSVDLIQQQMELLRSANQSTLGSEADLRAALLPLLRQQAELYQRIAALRFPDAAELYEKQRAGTITPAELERLRQYVALQGQLLANMQAQGDITGPAEQGRVDAALSDFYGPLDRETKPRETRRRYREFNDPERNDNQLTVGQGVEVGAMDWVMSLGTRGEQVAQALQSSIGTTVHSISDGIYGWITGTQSWGDTLRNLGASLLNTLLDTLVQMGVQWVINAAIGKGTMFGLFATGTALRKAETADVVANEAAKAPAIQSNAAGASISSFGLAAALGVAALVAAMAMFGGFRERGGDVRPGRAYVVGEKRPEVFVPRTAGTILPSIDGLAVPPAARAATAAVAPPVAAPSFVGGGSATTLKRERTIAVVPPTTMRQILRNDPEAENVIADVMYRRRGDIL